ncbi:MAG: hypothetical protein H8E96_07455 [Verrucomicrobiaceae bacterium]|nr:hypothetical protein [Verrucomicrobiaceae bacterium]
MVKHHDNGLALGKRHHALYKDPSFAARNSVITSSAPTPWVRTSAKKQSRDEKTIY